MTNSAEKTFEIFHERKPGDPVYPLEDQPSGLLRLDVKIPRMILIGKAIRVLYQSDKWNKIGDTVVYYHDHGPKDGKVVFSRENLTELHVPQNIAHLYRGVLRSSSEERSSGPRAPVKWPMAIVLIGECVGWYAQPELDAKKLIHGVTTNCILVSSPHGWLDKNDPERVFLGIVDMKSLKVEGIIVGPELRLTAAGIEG